jgi:hypothetical protein
MFVYVLTKNRISGLTWSRHVWPQNMSITQDSFRMSRSYGQIDLLTIQSQIGQKRKQRNLLIHSVYNNPTSAQAPVSKLEGQVLRVVDGVIKSGPVPKSSTKALEYWPRHLLRASRVCAFPLTNWKRHLIYNLDKFNPRGTAFKSQHSVDLQCNGGSDSAVMTYRITAPQHEK